MATQTKVFTKNLLASDVTVLFHNFQRFFLVFTTCVLWDSGLIWYCIISTWKCFVDYYHIFMMWKLMYEVVPARSMHLQGRCYNVDTPYTRSLILVHIDGRCSFCSVCTTVWYLNLVKYCKCTMVLYINLVQYCKCTMVLYLVHESCSVL